MNWDQVEELELFVIRCIRPWTNDNYSSWHIVKIPFQSSKEYQYKSIQVTPLFLYFTCYCSSTQLHYKSSPTNLEGPPGQEKQKSKESKGEENIT